MIKDPILAAIRAHAQAEFPREACGVVIVRKGRQRYIACRNIAGGNDHFAIHPEDYAAAEEQGEVIRIVHSHPNSAPLPSEADLVGCEASGLPWLIVNCPNGQVHEFAPSGYQAPLIGRSFHHGVLDCYSLIRDYYQRELSITLPDFERADDWWLSGGNLYEDGFESAGFNVVDTVQQHDVLLMQIAAPVANHAAVYIGDGLILQHCMGRLSSRDVYGGYWQKCTVKILRHQACAK